jgi:SAM-dependent methyltransferase
VQFYETIRNATPAPLRRLSRKIKRELRWALNSRQPPKAVFERTYREARWGDGGGNFYSGPGSIGRAAEHYADQINAFIAEHRIHSVVDLGCGDFRVASRIAREGVDYIGLDVVDELIERNTVKFGTERVRFQCLDITKDPLPDGELCLIREVLQHLSNQEIADVLRAVSKYHFVIYSDYQPAWTPGFVPNRDIGHGHDTRLWKNSAVCLDQPPFNIPVELLFEVPSAECLLNPGERIRTFLLAPTRAPHYGHVVKSEYGR